MRAVETHAEVLQAVREWNLGNFFYLNVLGPLMPGRQLGEGFAILDDAPKHPKRSIGSWNGDPLLIALLRELATADAEAAESLLRFVKENAFEDRCRQDYATDPSGFIDSLRAVTWDELDFALNNGTLVNKSDWRTGTPAAIPDDEEISGAFLNTPIPTARLDAALLATFLRASQSNGAGLGLRLQQVAIVSEDTSSKTDWNSLTLPFGLGFAGCWFQEWVWATRMTAPFLMFDACDFTPRSGFNAPGGSLDFSDGTIGQIKLFSCSGLHQVFAVDARIDTLDLRVEFAGGARIVADGLQSRSVYLGEVDGLSQLRLPDATVKSLTLPREADFFSHVELDLERAQIATSNIALRPDTPLSPESLPAIDWARWDHDEWLRTSRWRPRKLPAGRVIGTRYEPERPIDPRRSLTPVRWRAEWLDERLRGQPARFKVVAEQPPQGDEGNQGDSSLEVLVDTRSRSERFSSLSRSRAGRVLHNPQHWAELSENLEAAGHDADARELRILAERNRSAGYSRPVQALRWLTLDLTVRYFHANVRALLWLGLLFLATVGVALGWHHEIPGAPVHAGGWDLLPWAIQYSLDVTIAPLSLGQTDNLWPNNWMVGLVFALLKLASLAMFALFITGITGVTTRTSKNA